MWNSQTCYWHFSISHWFLSAIFCPIDKDSKQSILSLSIIITLGFLTYIKLSAPLYPKISFACPNRFFCFILQSLLICLSHLHGHTHSIHIYWISGKEKVRGAAVSKEGHTDSLLGYERTRHNWFPWAR